MWIAGDPSNAVMAASNAPTPTWVWVLVVALIAFAFFPRE
jgi:hypothetical protein